MRFLTLVTLVTCAALGAQDAPKTKAPAKKSKASAPKADSYSATLPKPTRTGVRYGDHERHVLDFWKAESAAPTPCSRLASRSSPLTIASSTATPRSTPRPP